MNGKLKNVVFAGYIWMVAGAIRGLAAEPPKGPYQPNGESLEAVNEAPDWFRDAKIGIYFHWGVYSVPAFGSEWYPRTMHVQKRVKDHHLKTWGEIEKFGYADFVPMFKAENFDAEEWVDLFVRAGARFAGPVAEHHDGFAMWDSELTPWNAADKVVDTLVDIVSKNGQLLLNISPRADGTIPEDQRSVLLAMGKWLGVNGEAIYNTRPWLAFGEGPTRMKKGGHFVGHIRYGAADVRYTRSKDESVLYATLLGWPEGPVTLQKIKAEGKPGKVSLLGLDAPVHCEVNELGQPVVTMPAPANKDRPSAYAHSLKFSGWTFFLNE